MSKLAQRELTITPPTSKITALGTFSEGMTVIGTTLVLKREADLFVGRD